MQIHDLVQGSPGWHLHRQNYWNASDAPAMMGVSKYKTRAELLHERHTGIVPEVDVATQRRFDEGHRFEALARLLAEEIIGESLYPVTGTEGKFSASFDGLTMLEDVIYEHKRLNDAIRAVGTVYDLDQMYHVQMEQQCLVSGATKVLFLASNWDEQGNLLEEKHFWYEPNLELRERIVQGWAQFEKDLAEYVPVVHAEKPEPDAVMQLPALSIQTSGSISIISNLDLFGRKLNEFVEGLDLEPTDDQGFANAEAAVKTLQKAQEALEAAEASALAQASSVDEMRRAVALYAETARKTRIMLEKMVKARKEQIKNEIIGKAKEAFHEHLFSLEAEIKPLRLIVQQPDLIGAAKNKRTLASLHDAIETALANGKITADAVAKDVRAKLSWYREYAKGFEFLFADLDRAVYKPEDDFQLLVKNRIDQHKLDEKRKLEAEQERIRAEEQKKAEEKVRAEQAEAARKIAEEAARSAPEANKPVLVKAAEKPAYSPALMSLARHELAHIRKKYAAIPELSGVMREIDSFLASTEQRELAEA
jgi:predicted phage-related endonuclease